MPRFDVTAPNGQIFRVDTPEGATQDQAIAYVATEIYPRWLEENKPKPERGIGQLFTEGLKRGTAQTGVLLGDYLPAMLGRGAQKTAEALGAEGIAAAAGSYAEQQLHEAAQSELDIAKKYPSEFKSYEDITGPISALRYGAETLGEGLPSIVPGLVTGGAGAVLSRGLTAGGRALATAAATGAGSAAQTVPEAYASILKERGQEELGPSLIAGGINAALESVLPASVIGKMTGPTKDALVGSIKKRLGLGLVEGAAMEGLTEGMQEAVNKAAVSFVDDNKEFFTSDNWKQVLDSAIRGAIVGGPVTGVTNVIAGQREAPAAAPTPAPAVPEEAPVTPPTTPAPGPEEAPLVPPPTDQEPQVPEGEPLPPEAPAPAAPTPAPAPAPAPATPAPVEPTPAPTPAPAPAPVPEQIVPSPAPTGELPTINLPAPLAGAKPKYNFGTASFTPQFANDIDKALYITAQAKPSPKDKEYRQFLQDNGFTLAQIQIYGKGVRDYLKGKAQALINSGQNGGVIPVDYMREINPDTYKTITGAKPLPAAPTPVAPTPAPKPAPKAKPPAGSAPIIPPTQNLPPPTPLVTPTPGLTPKPARIDVSPLSEKEFNTAVPGIVDVARTLIQGLFPGTHFELQSTTIPGAYGRAETAIGYRPPGVPQYIIKLDLPKMKAVAGNPEAAKQYILKTLFHELSHPLEFTWISQADDQTFNAVIEQYVKQRNPASVERFFLLEAIRNPDKVADPNFTDATLNAAGLTRAQYEAFKKSTTKSVTTAAGENVKKTPVGRDYQRSFSEWIAESGARWMANELKNIVPKTTFQKFQKSVLDGLKKLYADIAKMLGIKPKQGAFEKLLRDVYGNRVTTPYAEFIVKTKPGVNKIINDTVGEAISTSPNSIIGLDSEAEAIACLRQNSEALASGGVAAVSLLRVDTVRTVQLQRRVVLVGLDDTPADAQAPQPEAKPRRLRAVRQEPEPTPEPVQQAEPEPAVTELAGVLDGDSAPDGADTAAAPEPTPAPESAQEPDYDTSDRVSRPDIAPWEVVVTGCVVELRVGEVWSHKTYTKPESASLIGHKLTSHMMSGASGPSSIAQTFDAGRAPAAPEL